jgi:hypothetical protein
MGLETSKRPEFRQPLEGKAPDGEEKMSWPAMPLLCLLTVMAAMPPSLAAQGVLTGNIKASSQQKASRSVVIVDALDGPGVWYAFADRDGKYTLGPFPPGRYRVCAQANYSELAGKNLTIEAGVKTFSPRLSPSIHKNQCPAAVKVLLSLTPDQYSEVTVRLQKSSGSWGGRSYSIALTGDGKLVATAPAAELVFGSPSPSSSPATQVGYDAALQIITHLYATGFFALDGMQSSMFTDASLTTLSFEWHGLVKSFGHLSGGCPEELCEIEEHMESLAGVQTRPSSDPSRSPAN